jgi:hypothetical protein
MTRLTHPSIAILLLSLTSLAQTTTTGRVEGRVVATDGNPIPGATVRMTTSLPEVQPPVSYVEVTGPNGAFTGGVTPGPYSVTVERTGFKMVELAHMQVSAGGTQRVELRMVRLSTVSGRVVDEDGEPVARAGVELLRPFDYYGTLGFSRETWAQVDENGQFRISNVETGNYVLSANPQSSIPPRRSPDGAINNVVVGRSAEEENLPAYFPGGVRDPREATTIRVDAPIQGLELRVPRGSRFTIRGSVIPPDGLGSQRVYLSIRNALGLVGSAGVGLRAPVIAGEFETERLPPGRYSITAAYLSTRDAPHPPHFGHTDVTVVDRHVEGLRISMSGAAIALSGRIRIEGVDDFAGYVQRTNALFQPPRGPNTLRLNETQDYLLGKPIVVRAADTNGVFRAEGVVPARYRLEPLVYPVNSYVRRILVNGKEIPNGEIDLTSGESATLEVVYAIDGGKVEFIPPPGWLASVPSDAPVPRGHWIQLWPIRTDTPLPGVVGSQALSNSRTFPSLENLPPGEYYTALFDELPPLGLSQSTLFLRLLNGLASPVTVRSGATTTLQPKVISREQMQAALAVFPRDAMK